ncbi:MAG: leucine-rich repeat domain-containing protein [Bacteroidales bacterium]|jgi:Leucine-rich repeat (LRR) protein|nr:leucine-rich repeat domain-containing protein [Bacteroidales bacterium]
MKFYKYLLNSALLLLFLLCIPKTYCQLLSDGELAQRHLYTSLEEALKEPEKVYRLELVRAKKLDTLPDAVFKLKNLQVLTIKSSQLLQLNGRISEFSNLQYLNLDHNRIVMLPNTLGDLKHLKTLIISRNYIEMLPDSIGKLTTLRLLNAWGNDLYVLPESISLLYNTLQELDLRQINFRRNELETIEHQLPKTKVLYTDLCDCERKK